MPSTEQIATICTWAAIALGGANVILSFVLNIVHEFAVTYFILAILEGAYYVYFFYYFRFFGFIMILSIRGSKWAEEFFGFIYYKLGRGLLIILYFIFTIRLAVFFGRNGKREEAYGDPRYTFYAIGIAMAVVGAVVCVCSFKEVYNFVYS